MPHARQLRSKYPGSRMEGPGCRRARFFKPKGELNDWIRMGLLGWIRAIACRRREQTRTACIRILRECAKVDNEYIYNLLQINHKENVSLTARAPIFCWRLSSYQTDCDCSGALQSSWVCLKMDILNPELEASTGGSFVAILAACEAQHSPN